MDPSNRSSSETLELYKYSLNPLLKLAPNSEHMLELAKGKVKLTPTAFLSPTSYDSSVPAHKHLALTYYPSHRHRLNVDTRTFTLFDNVGERITGSTIGDGTPRVWPAFGQDGGGQEVLLVDDEKIISRIDFDRNPFTLVNGGAIDSFHQDSGQKYDFDLAEQIAQGVYDGVRGSGLDIGEQKIIGKVNEDGFPVLGWKMAGRSYSLSVGYKIFGNQIKLKFWAYLWADSAGTRHLLSPLIETFTCSIWPYGAALDPVKFKSLLRSRLQDRKYPYALVSDVIRRILTRATKINQISFETRGKKTKLLPSH